MSTWVILPFSTYIIRNVDIRDSVIQRLHRDLLFPIIIFFYFFFLVTPILILLMCCVVAHKLVLVTKQWQSWWFLYFHTAICSCENLMEVLFQCCYSLSDIASEVLNMPWHMCTYWTRTMSVETLWRHSLSPYDDRA